MIRIVIAAIVLMLSYQMVEPESLLGWVGVILMSFVIGFLLNIALAGVITAIGAMFK